MPKPQQHEEIVGQRIVLGIRRWAGRFLMAIPFGLALCGWAWSTFSDPYRSHLVLDLTILAVVCLVVWGCLQAYFGGGDRRWNRWITAYAVLISWWIAISTTSLITSEPLPVDPERFGDTWRHSQPIEHGLKWQDEPFAIALSGGGYRAAVFHAGALDMLERLGLQPTHMSTVSGGSIIGSYYWRGGTPVDFKNAVADARFNFKRKAFTFPTTLMFLSPSYSRLSVQAELLDDVLLEGVRHQSSVGSEHPELAINATDLSHGLQIGFLENYVFITGPLNQLISAHETDATVMRLSERVAISGAFPGAFPSAGLSVTPQQAKTETRDLVLADGGIGDNTGFQLMSRLTEFACDDSRVTEWCVRPTNGTKVVSDGGAIFAIQSDMSTLRQLSQMFDVSLLLRESWLKRQVRADVSFVPRNGFFNVKEAFSYPGGNEKLNEKGIGVRNFPFDPLMYPVVVLEVLGALLPSQEERDAYAAHLHQLVELSEFHAANASATPTQRLFPYFGDGMAPPHHISSYEECVERLKRGFPNPEICEAVGMRLLVLAQLETDVSMFAETDTLLDTFTHDRADAIFRAGQFMVLMQWRALLRNMGPPEWAEAMKQLRRSSTSPPSFKTLEPDTDD